jgi:hypothetical protein
MKKPIRLSKKRAMHKTKIASEIATKKLMRLAFCSDDTEDMMMQEHTDILQNIEFALITACQEDDSIDDRIIADALTSAILSQIPAYQLSNELLKKLRNMRTMHKDVPDSLWRNGLSTVLMSVDRHSDLRPGTKDYINFVLHFM